MQSSFSDGRDEHLRQISNAILIGAAPAPTAFNQFHRSTNSQTRPLSISNAR